MEFRKLKLKAFPQVQDRETNEAKYWKQFTTSLEDKLVGAPNCISFDPTGSGSYLVSVSTRVTLYDSNDTVQRSFTRFNDEAFSAKYRKDGKLFVCGDKDGHVKVFDVQTKSMLRDLKSHTAAVRATGWLADGLHMVSASDDRTVSVWDLGTGEVVWQNKDSHSDYVRSVDSSIVDPNIFISGSYDHTVVCWDKRQKASVQRLTHGDPVSSCMFAPSGTMFLSSGGNEVKVWDLLGGSAWGSNVEEKKCLHTFRNHQKHVTALAMTSSASRILSAGLDGHIKIYNFQSMQSSYGMKFDSPLLSLAISPDSAKLVAGFVDGNLITKNRHLDASSGENDAEDDDLDFGFGRKRLNVNGRYYKGAGGEIKSASDSSGVVETERAAKLQPYEAHLKKFNYQAALDAALRSRNPVVAVTVLEELCRRSALVVALSGRDEATLEPLLSFCTRFIAHPRYSRLVLQVTQSLLDLYASCLGRSEAIDELFLKLHRQVKLEVGFQRQIMRVLGALDGIISSSHMALTK